MYAFILFITLIQGFNLVYLYANIQVWKYFCILALNLKTAVNFRTNKNPPFMCRHKWGVFICFYRYLFALID